MTTFSLAMDTVSFGSFQLTGGSTFINLVAATTNALNGALLARRPTTTRTSRSSASCSWRCSAESVAVSAAT